MEPGQQIGEWVVEEVLEGDGRFRCHRVDSPFRKAVLTAFRGPDQGAARQLAGQMARLHHPNIGGVLGAEVSGDDLYVVAELVQGTTLRAFLRGGEAGRLPYKTALTMAHELADALVAAHERGVVHGDVRPDNVLLGLDGKARLVGFERMGTSDDLAVALRYSAPELVQRGAQPTPLSDAWSFGVLLYEVFAGDAAEPAIPRDRPLHLPETAPRPLRDAVTSLTHPDPVVRPALAKVRQLLLQQVLELSQTTLDDTFRSTEPDVAPPMPTRIGRYDVVRELGRGGVGVVYEGVDPVLHRRVALKLLIAGTWARPREVQRFKLEAQAVARLDHPNIVKILDIGGDLEGAWFAMEFVDGPSLADALVARGGRLPWREAVAITAQIARALQHAHDAGLLHRDVKPNNVLLDGDRAKLADFGLAFDADAAATRLTGTGQVLGTPTYMAPEQAAGELDRLSPRTDVYGLGVLLYETLSGRVPHDGNTPLQVIANILSGDTAPVRRHAPELPKELDTITAKALRLDPADRYASAAAFATDLDRLLAGDAILAADPTAWQRLRHFASRHARLLVTAAVAGVVVLVAVLGVGAVASALLAERRERDAADALEGTRRLMAGAVAAGRPDDAEAAFRTFVTRPDFAGTAALVEAWRERARERAAAGDGEGRLSALSSAYLAARRPPEIDATVLDLAAAAEQEREWELLLRLGDLVARRYPAMTEPIRPRVRTALAAQRQLSAAAERVSGDAAAAALAQLASATRTPWREAEVHRVGTDRYLVDVADHLWPADRALVADPGDAPLAAPHVPWALPFEGRPTAILRTPGPEPTALWARTEAGFSPLPPLPLGDVGPVVAADLDADGREELWVGAWRKLYRADRDGEGWRVTEPHAETNESNSQIRSVVASDVDADGRTDLVVALAEWGAYDVRWFTWDAGAAGLALRGRTKLGTVSALVPSRDAGGAPIVVACKEHTFPNVRVFPEDRPYGEADGVWELRFSADGTVARRLVDDGPCSVMFAGDVDGDGDDDLVVGDDEDSRVLLRRADPAGDVFDQLPLRKTRASTLLQADDDPALELVAWDIADDRTTWVLGTGSDALPPLPVQPLPRHPAPAGTAAFHEAWQRADDLVAIGRLADAQRAFRELAGLAWGSDASTEAVLRAADLAFARGARDDAATLYLEADGLGADGALSAAARAVRGYDDRRELELLEEAARRGVLDAEGAERRSLLLPLDAPPVELRFDGPLDPALSVEDPLSVAHDEGRGELVLEPTHPAVLLRVPVVTDGRWLGVELDGVADRTEWGAELVFGLVPRGATEPLYGASVGGRGGGEVVQRFLECVSPAARDGVAAPDVPGGRLWVSAWFQRDGVVHCDTDGGAPWGDTWDRHPFDWAPGAWDFVVVSRSAPTAAASVRLRSVTLRGVRRDPDAPPADPASRALVAGDPGGEGVDALVAALHREDVPGVVALLARAPDDEAWARVRRWVLHARLDTYGAALRPALGASWFPLLAEAWESPLLSEGRRDPDLSHMLLRWTEGAEAAAPEGEGAASRLQLLLLAKGGAALHQQRWATARAALERAVALGLPASPSADEVRWTRNWVAVGLVDLAEIAVHDGDPERARRLLAEARATTAVPLVLADTVAARPALAALAE